MCHANQINIMHYSNSIKFLKRNDKTISLKNCRIRMTKNGILLGRNNELSSQLILNKIQIHFF